MISYNLNLHEFLIKLKKTVNVVKNDTNIMSNVVNNNKDILLRFKEKMCPAVRHKHPKKSS